MTEAHSASSGRAGSRPRALTALRGKRKGSKALRHPLSTCSSGAGTCQGAHCPRAVSVQADGQSTPCRSVQTLSQGERAWF